MSLTIPCFNVQAGEKDVRLNYKYRINLERSYQYRSSDHDKQRPIKRVEGPKKKKAKIAPAVECIGKKVTKCCFF